MFAWLFLEIFKLTRRMRGGVAVWSAKAVVTSARVVSHRVGTRSMLAARRRRTLILIQVAVHAPIADVTRALVRQIVIRAVAV